MNHLTEYLQRPLDPFQRGVSDCCAWVVKWGEEISGEKIAENYLKPMTGVQAIQLLRENGGMSRLASRVFIDAGFEFVRENFQDGDIVVVQHSRALLDESIGLVSAGKLVTVSEKGGLVFLKIENVKGGWRWE